MMPLVMLTGLVTRTWTLLPPEAEGAPFTWLTAAPKVPPVLVKLSVPVLLASVRLARTMEMLLP